MKKQILLIAAIFIATFNSFSQTFIHITDIHVSSVVSYVNSCDLNGVMAQCYLQEFSSLNPKPDFLLASGDISNVGNGDTDMYWVLTQFLYPHPSPSYPSPGDLFIDSAKTIPIYFTPGNHDYYTTLYPPGSLTQLDHPTTYAKHMDPDTDYVISYPNVVILMVRSGYDIAYWDEWDALNPDGSGLTDSQCTWIRNVLSANKSKRKIIVMHHPVSNVAGTNCDGTPYTAESIYTSTESCISNDLQTMKNICDSNNVDIMLTGHQHQNVVTDENGNMIDENCTTCGTRYVQTGAAFNGCYRIISVSPTFVTVGLPMQSCITTSFDDAEKLYFGIDIYPNPAIDYISVETHQKATIEILNVDGQLLNTTETDGKIAYIDISDFAKGFYLIRVQSEKGLTVRKFVKI
jgi:3',5'-cyclic AMP phosphodiesterase CpdA